MMHMYENVTQQSPFLSIVTKMKIRLIEAKKNFDQKEKDKGDATMFIRGPQCS